MTRDKERRISIASHKAYYNRNCPPGYINFLARHSRYSWELRDIATHKNFSREAAIILLTEDLSKRCISDDMVGVHDVLEDMESNIARKFYSDPEILDIIWEKDMVKDQKRYVPNMVKSLIFHLGTEHLLVMRILDEFPDKNGSLRHEYLAVQN